MGMLFIFLNKSRLVYGQAYVPSWRVLMCSQSGCVQWGPGEVSVSLRSS